MKPFRIEADAIIYAEDLEAAFRKIGKYYTDLANDEADDFLLDSGRIDIYGVEPTEATEATPE